MEEKRLIGPKEVARMLNVPLSWVYQRTCKGKEAIPHVKVGKYVRFNLEEVLEFLKKGDKGLG